MLCLSRLLLGLTGRNTATGGGGADNVVNSTDNVVNGADNVTN